MGSVTTDEDLFERFRERGDAAALGTLFDRVAPTLLRIALHLAPDLAAAEDLVQATFVLAIEARAEWDVRRPVVPWLCGILNNRARTARRRERVPDPHRLPARAVADPAHAAEVAEFDAAVDAAIAALPEVYRPVLRLYLAYGLPPTEIAHALERPPGTVRSQLARGLELLRKALPPSLVPGALVPGLACALPAGRGLAAVKQTVLGRAALEAPVVSGSLVGGAVLMKKTMTMAGLAVLAAGIWMAWPAGGAAGTPVPRDDVSNTAPAAVSLTRGVTAAATAPADYERTDAATPPLPTTGSLRLRCKYGEDGSPAAAIAVSIEPSVPDGGLLARTVTTDGEGLVTVTDLLAARTWIEADRGGTLQVEVEAGRSKDAELVIPAGLHVRGRVTDEHGAPVFPANVWLSDGAHDYCDGCQVAQTDRDGRFLLRSVEPERFLGASAPGLRAAVPVPLRGAPGTAIDVELVLRGPGASLSGRVTDPDGRSVAGARILVGARMKSLRWNPGMHAGYRPPPELTTDANGCFRADGLPLGKEQWLWVRARGFCVHCDRVAMADAGDTTVEVRLQHGAALAGRATDAAGRPLAGVFVDYRSTAWLSVYGGFAEQYGPDWAYAGAATDADGRYRIEQIAPGTLRLLARNDELEVRGEVAVAEGETAAWDPVLVECVIRGCVVDERGEPLRDWRVMGCPPRGKGNMASATTDAEGRFHCATLAPVPYVLQFYAAGDHVCARPAASRFGIEPGGEELVVQVPDVAIPSATLTGVLLDTDGRPPSSAVVYYSAAGLRNNVQEKVESDGRFRIGPLPAGTGRLQGSVRISDNMHRRSAWSEPFELAARETRDVGVLQMPATGVIDVTATGPDGAPLDGLSVVLEDSTGWSENPWLAGKLAQGRLRIADLAPGDYRVRLGGSGGLPTVYFPVTVRAGETAPVEAHVPAGVACKLVLSPVSEPVPIHETFVWHRDGALYQRYTNWVEGNGEMSWPCRLLTGSYELAITSETGRCEVNRFVVGPDDPPDRTIAIRLP